MARRGIGRTFQVIRVFPELTAFENLLAVTNEPIEAARHKAEELLGFVTLTRLARLRDQGKTIIIVEHDMKVVVGLCETVYVLDYGEKIAEGPASVIQSNERVIEAYFGR